MRISLQTVNKPSSYLTNNISAQTDFADVPCKYAIGMQCITRWAQNPLNIQNFQQLLVIYSFYEFHKHKKFSKLQ